MDHSEAQRLHAAEKYVLGELPPSVRDEYEEHFFDCQECAADVRTAVAFVSASRSALASMPNEVESDGPALWGTIARFFRPIWTAPAIALLLVALTLQSFSSRPNLKGRSTPEALGSASFVSLIGANSRAAAARSFTVAEGRPLIVELDIPGTAEYSSYECQLHDPVGHIVLNSTVSLAEAKNSVHLILPAAQLQSGPYRLSVLGRPSAGTSAEAEVLQIKFTMEVIP